MIENYIYIVADHFARGSESEGTYYLLLEAVNPRAKCPVLLDRIKLGHYIIQSLFFYQIRHKFTVSVKGELTVMDTDDKSQIKSLSFSNHTSMIKLPAANPPRHLEIIKTDITSLSVHEHTWAPLARGRLSTVAAWAGAGPGLRAGENYAADRWSPIPPWDFKLAVRPRPSTDPTVLETSSRYPATRLSPVTLPTTDESLPRTQIKNPEIPASESFLLLSVEELVDVSARWFEHLVWDPRKFVTWNFCPEEGRAVRCWGGAAACDTQIWCEEEMPVVTRSRLSAARGDGAGALPWGSASAAPALRHDAGAPREGVASKNHHHHHGLKEKLRALTQDYEQQKQKLAASQLRRSIRCLNAWEAINDENAEEDGGRVAKFRYDAFAQVPESAVLRENVAPPQARAPSNDGAVLARTTEPQAKENAVGRGANAMSCPTKKAVPALPVLPVPPARKLSLGGAVGGKLKAAGEVGAGTAEAAESRILVFVRLRPMSRKEKEAGSRSCVKIVNRKEVFLTESASENDYLRLKRGRDSHFCFDSVFPDSTTQAEVYSTS